VGLFSLNSAFASSGFYKSMAKEFVKSVPSGGIGKLAVVGFADKSGVPSQELEYVSDRLITEIVKLGKVSVVERKLLDKIFQEQKLAVLGISDSIQTLKLGTILSVDAIISGSVFAAGDNLKIIAKMIDVRNGKIIHAFEGETQREWLDGPELVKFDVKLVKFDEFPSDFRDSPNDVQEDNCTKFHSELQVLQKMTVELKARYWALTMKSPGFSNSMLTRNPGSEITNREMKQEFYELLKRYYRTENLPQLTYAEKERIKSVFEKEKKVNDECGLY
jgi:TolB-like protein